MFKTHSNKPENRYAEKFRSLSQRATALAQEVTQREATARDVAESIELQQQYLDLLDELLDEDLTIPAEPIVVKVNGSKIRFNSIDEVAAWITNRH